MHTLTSSRSTPLQNICSHQDQSIPLRTWRWYLRRRQMPGRRERRLRLLSTDASGARHTAAVGLRREQSAARGPAATSAAVSHCCYLMRAPLRSRLEALARILWVSLSSACCNVAVAVSTLHEINSNIYSKNSKHFCGVHKILLAQCTGDSKFRILARRRPKKAASGEAHHPPAHKLSRTRQEGEAAAETDTLVVTSIPSAFSLPAYFSAARLREPPR